MGWARIGKTQAEALVDVVSIILAKPKRLSLFFAVLSKIGTLLLTRVVGSSSL